MTYHRSTGRRELVPAALTCSKGGRASEVRDISPFQIIDISVVSEVMRGGIGDFGEVKMVYYR